METEITNTQEVQESKLSKKARFGFVFAVVSLVAWVIPLVGLPVGIIGLVKSIKGRKGPLKKLATAGMAMCILSLTLSIANAAIGGYMAATGQHEIVNEIFEEK